MVEPSMQLLGQKLTKSMTKQTANLILAGNDKAAVNDALQELLKDKVSVGGHSKGSNRNKIISILRKIWVTTPKEIVPLRNDGLALLSTHHSSLAPHHVSVAIHWGMVMSVYPFWSSVATQTGRLLRLQGSATRSDRQPEPFPVSDQADPRRRPYSCVIPTRSSPPRAGRRPYYVTARQI
ncbi:MAG: hypothetical protein ABFD81_11795 [Syntrophaceae bacterium]